ncbi:hypothetical protein A3G63_02375 [Candidatus Kaiserbacteria bacterium RIFCSPLOWO2_12_FULL_52_8]|uniref:DUF5672 domain-containing protein n=1 Tax=Candidatus Kaiserbacteria bacterium RIFCSPHIGHO2_01_FULL_53_31 TaxID=1798481 RepID=A0A1F6CG43_9BACT|nr:MAG: hypothetical protein A2678_01465 [Candidatus Kaiserbacteria bacterium RIFCSPHIGHO2_01_FULL_53_31]OGG93880.1 MAG: hypothetical protein A3G63_02375 [Candidatus Kaiserbacteria bacterium RIFCSPLOWO2_12_FULL_52_8]
MKALPQVTLFGLDCVNIDRLLLAAEICQKDFIFGAVKLLTSIRSTHPDIITIPKVSSTAQYSEFMIKKLNRYIDTNFALIIQHDGFILNPAAWTDAFLKYDYIGAPWAHVPGADVGNGGFCLRSKKLIKLIHDNYRTLGGTLHPEDKYISLTARPFLESKGVRFAPESVAARFSMEGSEKYGVTWENQFGFHGLRWTDISRWRAKHPEYTIDNALDSWALGIKATVETGGTKTNVGN